MILASHDKTQCWSNLPLCTWYSYFSFFNTSKKFNCTMSACTKRQIEPTWGFFDRCICCNFSRLMKSSITLNGKKNVKPMISKSAGVAWTDVIWLIYYYLSCLIFLDRPGIQLQYCHLKSSDPLGFKVELEVQFCRHSYCMMCMTAWEPGGICTWWSNSMACGPCNHSHRAINTRTTVIEELESWQHFKSSQFADIVCILKHTCTMEAISSRFSYIVTFSQTLSIGNSIHSNLL